MTWNDVFKIGVVFFAGTLGIGLAGIVALWLADLVLDKW